MRERDLEDFLFRHPYLIDAAFGEVNTPLKQQQVKRGGGRLDLLFNLAEGLCIIELKKTKLTALDVAQLVGYCREWGKTDKLAPCHFLVGKRPKDDRKLKEAIATSEFQIKLIYLGEHLPVELVLDDETKQYRAVRLNESPTQIFRLRF